MIPAHKQTLFEDLFLVYTKRLLRSHFHGVHLRGAEQMQAIDRSLPLILFGNHSCWWDGLLDFYLCRTSFDLDPYLMMEEEQLRRYRFFTRLGAFSVNRASPRESYESVQYAISLFDKPNRALILYPQGVMTANDARPLRFSSGIGRIAAGLGKAQLVPLAHRYEFIREQRPEAFVSVGAPLVAEAVRNPKHLTSEAEAVGANLLESLRSAIASGDSHEFTRVVRGKSSTNVRYDKARGLDSTQ